MTRFAFLTFIFLVFAFILPAKADVSDASVLKAQKSMDAFTCSAVASIAGDEAYSQRLFTAGFNQGKLFLTAVNGNIAPADLGSKIPQAYSAARGPNVDFALGRVYQENMTRTMAYFNQQPDAADPAKRKMAAAQKFEELKCGGLKDPSAIKVK